MNALKNKLSKKGGFTLVEMLIVVAIIAILIAISIPLISNSLEKARKATDAANERSAKAEMIIMYLDGKVGTTADGSTITHTYGSKYAYDAAKGEVTGSDTGSFTYGQCSTHSGSYILVSINSTGEVTVTWKNDGAAHGSSAD